VGEEEEGKGAEEGDEGRNDDEDETEELMKCEKEEKGKLSLCLTN
jgi:hypothetical protein